MITEYSQTVRGGMQPHRAAVRTQLVVDPGNCFTKWVDCQTVRSIPSYVKELSEWEEGVRDDQSEEIEFSGHRYESRSLGTVDGWRSGFRVWQG